MSQQTDLSLTMQVYMQQQMLQMYMSRMVVEY